MYYDVCIHQRGEKVYRRELIRENFRRNGKACTPTAGKAGRNRKDPKHAKHNPKEMQPIRTAETRRTQSIPAWKFSRAEPRRRRGRKAQSSSQMDAGQHHAWVGTGQSRIQRLSRVCALTARSADGTELFHGLPRLCGLDRRGIEAVGMDPFAPLPVVNSKTVVDTTKNFESAGNHYRPIFYSLGLILGGSEHEFRRRCSMCSAKNTYFDLLFRICSVIISVVPSTAMRRRREQKRCSPG